MYGLVPASASIRPSRLIVQFTPVLALYDPFGVGVPLNLDITHTQTQSPLSLKCGISIITAREFPKCSINQRLHYKIVMRQVWTGHLQVTKDVP